jgi:hypothetical protein
MRSAVIWSEESEVDEKVGMKVGMKVEAGGAGCCAAVGLRTEAGYA